MVRLALPIFRLHPLTPIPSSNASIGSIAWASPRTRSGGRVVNDNDVINGRKINLISYDAAGLFLLPRDASRDRARSLLGVGRSIFYLRRNPLPGSVEL